MKKIVMTSIILLLMAGFVQAQHGPKETLKQQLDHAISLLSDAKYKDSSMAKEQQREFKKIIESTFDYKAVAVSALGKNRKRFKPEEFVEFKDLFAKLLISTYLNLLDSHYDDLSVKYLAEDIKTSKKALIKTSIRQGDKDIPVDYGMLLREGKWRIYDLKIEGVRMIGNYRKQYDKFLFKKSPGDLIVFLKKKIETLEHKDQSIN